MSSDLFKCPLNPSMGSEPNITPWHRIQMIIAHIREVLEDDTGRSEWDLHGLSLSLFPVKDAFHVWALYQKLITVPDSRLQEDPDGERQAV